MSRQHIRSFSKMQTCHMLTAQPSTYDMFALIELYGRKIQSGCRLDQKVEHLIMIKLIKKWLQDMEEEVHNDF